MTRDDIIRMARESGKVQPGIEYTMPVEVLERFAALVAAAEREACAALCFQMWDKWLDKDARDEFVRPDAEDCAAAIRARGQ